MNNPTYPFQASDDALFFEFRSVGKNGIVQKNIVFSPIDDQFYNLALGDVLANGSVSDRTVTDNDDLPKVIATVAQTLQLFSERYPEKYVYIEGSTSARTRLYRIIISREFDQIREKFQVYGLLETVLYEFSANQPYEAFVFKLKM